MRDIFDRGGIGLVLIGMPGLEKRLSRYAQLYSRVGFVHEFRPLTASEVRELRLQRWAPPGVTLLAEGLTDEAAVAAISSASLVATSASWSGSSLRPSGFWKSTLCRR